MLFEQLEIKDVTLKNRLMMAPMCQYCATNDGFPTSWHFVHYATRAIGGTGLIMVEATAVESRGRISDKDLGLWNDEQVPSFKKIVEECKKHRTTVGIQLAHSGRKCGVASETIIAPSSLEWSNEYKTPLELSKEDIQVIIGHYRDAAIRAVQAGFEVIELHAAHGYLIHQFLSPLSNFRKDEYGGSSENRVRFLLEVIAAVREVWSMEKPLFVRVSADDYLEGGINIQEMVRLLSYLPRDQVELIHVSSGGLLPADINLYQGYQVEYSEIIRKELGFLTCAVGLITEPIYADEILQQGKADMVALGRELLRNPYWPLMAAQDIGKDITWPSQYLRSRPR